MEGHLGEMLRERGLISDDQLVRALALQARSGDRLGDILIGTGTLNYHTLYHAIADHFSLPFADLLRHPPDASLLHAADADTYLRLRAMPWRRNREGRPIIAACGITEEAMDWVRRRFGAEAELAITSPLDIRRTVEARFGAALENASRLTLWERRPLASARVTLLPVQKKIAGATALSALAAAAAWPVPSALVAIAFCHAAYAVTMLFKSAVFLRGMGTAIRSYPVPADRQLPVYTVLVPMYREAASLPALLAAMQRMDYPPARLDIKLILEDDDPDTLDAAHALKPRYQFEIIRVPPGTPRTKPRACNYALRFARGEFVTVFDADDRPEPMQLKKAVAAFRALPPDVVCLQARLNYYNADANLLTRLFALEYAILFHFLLPGLERFQIPLPLGGTSNHIALQRLKSLGEWDPYNVTEDADLGTRLAVRGFRTAMLDSFTLEEAPEQAWPWIRQRTRWIKGYMQTWLVYMRDPAGLWRRLGWKSFLGFQCFVGLSTFTFLTAPLVWLLSIFWIARLMQGHGAPFPAWLGGLTLANLLLNLYMHWYMGLYCALHRRTGRGRVALAALAYPLYLWLHSLASYRGVWQLARKPHYWDKTTHGLAKETAQPVTAPEPAAFTGLYRGKRA